MRLLHCIHCKLCSCSFSLKGWEAHLDLEGIGGTHGDAFMVGSSVIAWFSLEGQECVCMEHVRLSREMNAFILMHSLWEALPFARERYKSRICNWALGSWESRRTLLWSIHSGKLCLLLTFSRGMRVKCLLLVVRVLLLPRWQDGIDCEDYRWSFSSSLTAVFFPFGLLLLDLLLLCQFRKPFCGRFQPAF